MNSDNFTSQSSQEFINKNYKIAFKLATKKYAEILKGPNAGRWGYGVRAICKKNNKFNLFCPNNRKLKPMEVTEAVDSNHAGLSPLKQGGPKSFLNNSQRHWQCIHP